MHDEMQFHLDSLTSEHSTAGMSEEAAKQAARRRFGSLSLAKERGHDVRGAVLLDEGVRELRHAARSLRRHPVFAVASMVTLALGIGATVAIATIVNAVLLRPLPYPEADRIVRLNHHAPGIDLPHVESLPVLITYYREHARTLARVAGFRTRAHNLTGNAHAERVHTLAATPDIFDVLAVRPALGRPFLESDAHPGAIPVAILTHTLWKSHFGSDPTVIGRRVALDGRPTEIVGVMAPSFAFPDASVQLLLPLWLDPASEFASFFTSAVARLETDATLEAARQEIESLQDGIPGARPEMLASFGWSVSVDRLREDLVGRVSVSLWPLLGSVGIVLLVAAANVASLFLVRVESRRREFAIKAALGAGRGRLAATLLAESFLLTLAAGLLGVVLAAAAIRMVVAFGPVSLPRLHEVRLDGSSVAAAAAIGLLMTVVIGLLPLLRLVRRLSLTLHRDGDRGNASGRDRQYLRRLLIAAQVGMAAVLLIGCGLLLQSVSRLYRVDPGFRTEGLLTMGVTLGAETDRDRAVVFYHRVLDDIATVPGVTAVAATNFLPFDAASMDGARFGLGGRDHAEVAVLRYAAVTADYFALLGIPLLDGRLPTREDAERSRPVAWVNHAFARQHLADHPVGERLVLLGVEMEVVGVVGDIPMCGLRAAAPPMAYLSIGTPVPSAHLDVMHLVMRTERDTVALAAALRATVDRVDPAVPLLGLRPMDEIVAASVVETTLMAALLTVAAVIAVVVGLVGLYGAIRYIVSQRTPEIGVRIALGADPRAVRAMVLRQGIHVTLIGVAAGLTVAAALTRFLATHLFGISPHDPATFAAVGVLLVAVSAFATYLPARQAAAIDPVQALRQDG